MAAQQAKKKGAPRSAGSRRTKIASYYELRYPERKLRRMAKNKDSVAKMREWADSYRTPSGGSGIGAFIKITRAFGLNGEQK